MDKEWRRKYDEKYRSDNKAEISKRQSEYTARPEVKRSQQEASKRWYDNHKDEVMSKHKLRDGTIEGKIRRWKAGARRRKIAWELSDDFVINLPRICYYTGLPLIMESGKSTTMSLDRIDSLKDYTEDNVRPCCSMVNLMKQDFGDSEFVEMCRIIVLNKDRRTVQSANDCVRTT